MKIVKLDERTIVFPPDDDLNYTLVLRYNKRTGIVHSYIRRRGRMTNNFNNYFVFINKCRVFSGYDVYEHNREILENYYHKYVDRNDYDLSNVSFLDLLMVITHPYLIDLKINSKTHNNIVYGINGKTIREFIFNLTRSKSKVLFKLLLEIIEISDSIHGVIVFETLRKFITVDGMQTIARYLIDNPAVKTELMNTFRHSYELVLPKFSSDQIVRYFTSRDHILTMNDIIMMNHDNNIPIPDLNNLKDIHDNMVEELTNFSDSVKYEKIKYSSTQTQLMDKIGNKIGDFNIVFPKNDNDLNRWGLLMRNCIGAYYNTLCNTDDIIFALEKEGDVIYNILVDSFLNVKQFYGRFNSKPNKEDDDLVRDYLGHL